MGDMGRKNNKGKKVKFRLFFYIVGGNFTPAS